MQLTTDVGLLQHDMSYGGYYATGRPIKFYLFLYYIISGQ